MALTSASIAGVTVTDKQIVVRMTTAGNGYTVPAGRRFVGGISSDDTGSTYMSINGVTLYIHPFYSGAGVSAKMPYPLILVAGTSITYGSGTATLLGIES